MIRMILRLKTLSSFLEIFYFFSKKIDGKKDKSNFAFGCVGVIEFYPNKRESQIREAVVKTPLIAIERIPRNCTAKSRQHFW